MDNITRSLPRWRTPGGKPGRTNGNVGWGRGVGRALPLNTTQSTQNIIQHQLNNINGAMLTWSGSGGHRARRLIDVGGHLLLFLDLGVDGALLCRVWLELFRCDRVWWCCSLRQCQRYLWECVDATVRRETTENMFCFFGFLTWFCFFFFFLP